MILYVWRFHHLLVFFLVCFQFPYSFIVNMFQLILVFVINLLLDIFEANIWVWKWFLSCLWLMNYLSWFTILDWLFTVLDRWCLVHKLLNFLLFVLSNKGCSFIYFIGIYDIIFSIVLSIWFHCWWPLFSIFVLFRFFSNFFIINILFRLFF